MKNGKVYLGTNTKMYKTIAQTLAYLRRLGSLTVDIPRSELELFVIPSFTALDASEEIARSSGITLGAQNMCWEEEGQFTGEISPLMLREVGVKVVELGHSERRHLFGETNEMIARKVACALKHDFTVLLCVGEQEEEKNERRAEAVLRAQLEIGLRDAATAEKLWVAYEPVWAIGVNGKPATAEYAEKMHGVIRGVLREKFGEAAETIPLLYGGSVRPDNACELICRRDVDGLFIGRSAWDADAFYRIITDVVRVR